MNDKHEEIEFLEAEENPKLQTLNDIAKEKIGDHLVIGTSDDDPMECDALFFSAEDSDDFPVVLPKASIVDADHGHREAITDSAALLVQAISATLKPEELPAQTQIVLTWGLECLNRIVDGEDPNRAFRWTSTTRGKRPDSVRKQIHDWMVALAVAIFKVKKPDMPIMNASDSAGSICDFVAEHMHMSPAAVEKAWKMHAPDIRQRMDV